MPYLVPQRLIGFLAFGLFLFCGNGFGAQPARLETEAEAIVSSMLELEPDLPYPFRTQVAVAQGPLTIHRAVEIALANNPTMISQRENIRYLALDLLTTRRDFHPKFRANFLFTQSEAAVTLNENERYSTDRTYFSQTLGVTQRFPFGGDLRLDAGGVYNEFTDRDNEFSPSAAMSLRLPLLRGFGIQYNTNNLVQRRQNLLYALRAFKLQQEDYAIRAIEGYLNLLRILKRLEYVQKRNDAAQRLLARTEAFFRIGRSSNLELARVEQEALRVKRDLGGATTDYKNRVDDYKIFLNLPVGAPLELQYWEPPEIPQSQLPSEQIAVEEALAKRVDLLTVADTIQDARRRLGISKNGLLPDLDVNLRAGMSNLTRSRYALLNEDYSASVAFSLPLERDQENLNFFDAYQDLQQAERNLQVAHYAMESSVRSGLRTLENVYEALKIQQELLKAAQRRLQFAQIRFEAGEVLSWEVIYAQNELLSEAIYELDLKQSRFVGILRLRSTMGKFDLNKPLPLASIQ